MTKIQDLKELKKLFGINIPRAQDFDYYISVLEQSPEHRGLSELIERFSAFERRCEQGIRSCKRETLGELCQTIEQSGAYQRLIKAPQPSSGPKIDRRLSHTGEYLLSLDIRQANYSNLKRFDDDGELAESWQEFCAEQSVDPMLIESKSYRQLVMGQLQPGKNQRQQHSIILQLWSDIKAQNLGFEEPVLLLHDELIVSAGEDLDRAHSLAGQLQEFLKSSDLPVPIRLSVQCLEAIEKGYYLQAQLDPESLKTHYRRLFGVPGNLYYLYFKKYVLEQPIDPRDLYFVMEGRLACWVIEEE